MSEKGLTSRMPRVRIPLRPRENKPESHTVSLALSAQLGTQEQAQRNTNDTIRPGASCRRCHHTVEQHGGCHRGPNWCTYHPHKGGPPGWCPCREFIGPRNDPRLAGSLDRVEGER